MGPDLFYRSLQEDEALEWATFWAFAIAAIVVGLLTAVAVQALYREHPEELQTAVVETEALMIDFLALAEIRCNTHKRIYTYRRQYDAEVLDGGAFASLITQGLAAERASFFLHPWNSPYWMRHRCDDHGATTLLVLYSFGPNRRCDSTRAEILGDDIGVLMDSQTGDGKSS